jgi:hypothetical protein
MAHYNIDKSKIIIQDDNGNTVHLSKRQAYDIFEWLQGELLEEETLKLPKVRPHQELPITGPEPSVTQNSEVGKREQYTLTRTCSLDGCDKIVLGECGRCNKSYCSIHLSQYQHMRDGMQVTDMLCTRCLADKMLNLWT